MNYKIDLQELDCEKMCAPQQLDELTSEYADRVEACKGKSILRVAFLEDEASTDDKAAIMRTDSPFYDASVAAARASMLAECMTQIGNVILAREKQKASVIVPGSEQDFRKLLGRG